MSELTVESNVTLEASTILSSWSNGLQLQVKDQSDQTQTVTLESREVTAGEHSFSFFTSFVLLLLTTFYTHEALGEPTQKIKEQIGLKERKPRGH